jgi:hypothetical protein
LDIGTPTSNYEKAELLNGVFEPSEILNLKFAQHDKWRSGQTIEDWLLNGQLIKERGKKTVSPRQQLEEYVTSPEITQLKKGQELAAYLVVVIGSRKVLFWKMDDDGVFREPPQLARSN